MSQSYCPYKSVGLFKLVLLHIMEREREEEMGRKREYKERKMREREMCAEKKETNRQGSENLASGFLWRERW